MATITISVDAMGGDFGPRVTLPAALSVLKKYQDLHIIFVGKPEFVLHRLEKLGADYKDRWTFQPASEVVAMDESPATAMRSKKDSSMRVAINLVKEGRAGACVSAGNTGALMATARFVLKTLPGIDRPALMARFPTLQGKEVRVLDLGANVDSAPEHLVQFAVMGATCVEEVTNCKNATVGLLNIGEEDIKGNEQVKEAAQQLNESAVVNYVGFIEGNDIFEGKVDVAVCDGFVGNSVLKACEGLAKLITSFAKQEMTGTFWSKLSVLPAFFVLKRLKKRIDPRKRNGATLLGLNGIVIKSHGGADLMAFATAVEEARLEVLKDIPGRITERLEKTLVVNSSE